MTILLFSLRGVPEDEADEVRELLTEQHIDFYKTSAGNWGMSLPAVRREKQEQNCFSYFIQWRKPFNPGVFCA